MLAFFSPLILDAWSQQRIRGEPFLGKHNTFYHMVLLENVPTGAGSIIHHIRP